MTGDANARWRRALEQLGAVVGSYDPALRVYTATVTDDVLKALAAADFVLAVEPIGIVEATHDTAVPAMGADALRAWDGSPGIFSGTGGASVPIAVMDTGLNINHLDIASNRESICGANFAWNSGWDGSDGPLLESEDLWIDDNGHGTHVTGTIAGNGAVEPPFAGMAPSVRHIRFAKVLDRNGFGFGDSVRRGMDYLAESSGCGEQGRMSDRAKPLIVNMSLSARSRLFQGRDVGARKLDSTVWSHRQLYVVAQANAGISGFSNYGAAKNSLAVGAVLDSSDLASFSSHGPTADGRLAPNVVATGVGVNSARGGGSRAGYNKISGTSMASPSVAGVAALLMDAVPAHRERPALTRARLMASAVRPDAWFADAAQFPLNNSGGPGAIQARYGMGKVSARTSALNRDRPDGWKSGSATSELQDGEYAYHDIVVPEGTSRLDLVMTWDEPPADTVASTVLNDLDLWLDREGDCSAQACGEYVSASRVDNVEWIIVANPEPGVYRAKVLAHRVYTAAPRAALAWTLIRGASTPNLQIETDTRALAADRSHELTLTLTSSSYLSAGTRLHVDCRDAADSSGCADLTIENMAVSREDGVSVSLLDELPLPIPLGYGIPSKPIHLGSSIPIGEVAAGESQEVAFLVSTGTEPARLYFRASAWNAKGASVAVDVGTPGGSQADAATPGNDGFAAAIALEGEEGSQPLDLLLATPEPGEPVFSSRDGRPAGSLWYRWTAPASGSFHVNVPQLESGFRVARHDRVDVFTGEDIAALDRVASGLWGATFFADKGTVYRFRASSFSRGSAMDLRWAPGGHPANDDFAEAAVLTGESGDFDGTSVGATVEPGESFGSMAATTWFRWTAPGDDAWMFGVSYPKRILAFEGDSLSTLRLISQQPGSNAYFAARGGKQYRIAVAEAGANSSPGPYTLFWSPEKPRTGNDRFADAEPMENESSSEHFIGVDSQSTVEPDEPMETGVRTKWWGWEAPADGLYTWRVQDIGEIVPTYPKLRVTAFAGTLIEDLQLAAATGPGAPFDFLLDAVGGEAYWIAAGLPAGDTSAFEQYDADAKLVWGPTPENDEPANAAPLSGTAGSISASNRFATTSRGERTHTLGRSSLWWTYEAPASGWVRFSVDGGGGPWTLTVHRHADDGFGGLEIVASSRWQRTDGYAAEVLFPASAGAHYTIALGVGGSGRGGEFTLRWDETEAPVWLRYVGRLADGARDSNGHPVEIRGPGNLALHGDGEALYLASALGLQVFERIPATGALNFLQLLEGDLQRSLLLWDAHRTRLLADDCGTWRSFGPVGGGRALEDKGELTAVGEPGTCGNHLLMDSHGSFVYRIGNDRVDLFAVEESGDLRFVQLYENGRLQRALISNTGSHVYAVTENSLISFERDAETGALTRTDSETSLSWRGEALAISDDDAYLFVFDNFGQQTNVFQLEDPSNPRRIQSLPRFWDAGYFSFQNRCRFAVKRNEVLAVDVFCPSSAFSVQWHPSDGELAGTDYLSNRQADRYNNAVPDFGPPEDMAVSPDGGHVYLSTPSHGILTFARGAPVEPGETGDPDLVIDSASVGGADPGAGESFMLSVVVRNRGDGPSAATTLRYYRSINTTISKADIEVGSAAVGRLAAAARSDKSISLTAPPNPGTYYYGACVDPVSDESESGNNCSSAVRVTLVDRGGPGGPDLVVQTLSVSDANPGAGGPFRVNTVVRNQGDGRSATTTLRYYRSINTTISKADIELGADAIIALAPSGTDDESFRLTAPSKPGSYNYGACVDPVSGETDTANNCSSAVSVVVNGNGSGQSE